jgi:hypothetical protein
VRRNISTTSKQSAIKGRESLPKCLDVFGESLMKRLSDHELQRQVDLHVPADLNFLCAESVFHDFQCSHAMTNPTGFQLGMRSGICMVY